METATLDDFMSLNDQLAAAVEAGVPLDVDLGRTKEEAAATLEKINALVARRASQGASLADAVASDDPVISPAYRCLMQLGLSSGNFSTALALSTHVGRTVDKAWHTGWLALFYPAVVCCVALVGMVGFCLFFVPVLESTYLSLRIPAGTGLMVLQSLRGTLPLWAVVLPVGIVALVAWAQRKSKPPTLRGRASLLTWLPSLSRAVFEERSATFAESVAALLDNGVAFPAALRIAADAWSNPPMAEATRSLAARVEQGQATNNDSHLVARFPPFLRWAILHSEATTGRVRALRTAADVYRKTAERRQERLQVIAPLLLAVVIGGSATLLYGLALFVPVVDMLRALAQ